MDSVLIKKIELNSIEYQKELELIDRVLKKPWGLSVYNDNLENDINYYHIGAYLGNELTGIITLIQISEHDFVLDKTEIRIKYLAIDENHSGRGIGTKLVYYAENFAQNLGLFKVVLNSRITSEKFYEKLGYKKISEEFVKDGVPVALCKMEKNLISHSNFKD